MQVYLRSVLLIFMHDIMNIDNSYNFVPPRNIIGF